MSVAASAGMPDPDAVNAAVRAIALRITAVRERLAHRVTERVRAAEEEPLRAGDTVTITDQIWLDLIDDFLASLHGAEPLTPARVERLREIAARRVLQRVPLESVTRRPRIWGQVMWEAVVASTVTSEPRECEAALSIGSKLMQLVDITSRVVTNAYLDGITDRGLLRRDLLDALIAGKGEDEGVRKLARSLHLTLSDSYMVVVVRGDQIHGELGRDEPLASRMAFDRIVEATRRHVQPAKGSLLAGMHRGDLVVMYPVSGPEDRKLVRADSVELARALPVEVSVGVSWCHDGLPAVAAAYAEARAAVEVADRLGIRGRAVGLDDVLVDKMLTASADAQRILLSAMQALVDYDKRHGSELVATLQAFVDSRFNLTKTGAMLFVHPNTVVYRLRRIRELTGHDPHDVDDLLVLWLGLKTLDLRERER